jgi:hypothetical protein
MGGNARRMYGIEEQIFVTEEPPPIERPDWFPQGSDLERFSEIVADPRHHTEELRALDLGDNPLTTMAAQLALAMESTATERGRVKE